MPRPAGPAVDAERAYTAQDLGPIRGDTPIEALPLSPRARNALDRAGYTRADELLDLPENRLSAIRGVGRLVTREVLAFRNAWKEFSAPTAPSTEVFAPDFAPPPHVRLTLEPTVDAEFASVLRDAGITSLSALAMAPRAQVEALAAKHGTEPDGLRSALRRLASSKRAPSGRETEQESHATHGESHASLVRPTGKTPAEWLDVLLPSRPKYATYLRGVYGLAPPFLGRLNVTMREAAEHFGCTRQNLYLAAGRARDKWLGVPELDDLLLLVGRIIQDAGGCISLARASDAILGLPSNPTLAPSREPDGALARAQAAALFRVAAEVDKGEVDGIRILRLVAEAPAPNEQNPPGAGGPDPVGRLFLVATQEHGDGLRRLGKAADRLAARDVLASPDKVKRDILAAAQGSPFEALDPARLVALAADVSSAGACSSRLEIYPRGMPPERALELIASAGVFRNKLKPIDLRRRVETRFPEAAPLPARPALDSLVASFALAWDPEAGHYTHRSGRLHTGLSTELHTHTQISATQPSAHWPGRVAARIKKVDKNARKSREFDEQLRIAVDRRLFRVLGVNVNHAFLAARALEARLGVEATPLDTELLGAFRPLMERYEVDEADVHALDREGPSGPEWGELCRFAAEAAEEMAAGLFGDGNAEGERHAAPLILTRPGLLARYDLRDFLARLVSAGKDNDARATFLLVPQFDERGVPHINRTLPIENAHGAVLHLPFAWIRDHLPAPDQGAA